MMQTVTISDEFIDANRCLKTAIYRALWRKAWRHYRILQKLDAIQQKISWRMLYTAIYKDVKAQAYRRDIIALKIQREQYKIYLEQYFED